MKRMAMTALTAGIIGAGITAYCLVNKNTKEKAHKVFNNALDVANDKVKKMS